jgi:hypothetical protein
MVKLKAILERVHLDAVLPLRGEHAPSRAVVGALADHIATWTVRGQSLNQGRRLGVFAFHVCPGGSKCQANSLVGSFLGWLATVDSGEAMAKAVNSSLTYDR